MQTATIRVIHKKVNILCVYKKETLYLYIFLLKKTIRGKSVMLSTPAGLKNMHPARVYTDICLISVFFLVHDACITVCVCDYKSLTQWLCVKKVTKRGIAFLLRSVTTQLSDLPLWSQFNR